MTEITQFACSALRYVYITAADDVTSYTSLWLVITMTLLKKCRPALTVKYRWLCRIAFIHTSTTELKQYSTSSIHNSRITFSNYTSLLIHLRSKRRRNTMQIT